MDEDGVEHEDGTVDILYLIESLEELVGTGKRVPFSHRVMVEEEEFLTLVDQLRVAIPNEIKQAQRVIKERERIIGAAQEEAANIVRGARDRASYLASQEGVLNEAKQQGERVLREAEEGRKRAMGEVDVYALKQLEKVEDAMREGLEIIEAAFRDTIATIDRAKSQVGP